LVKTPVRQPRSGALDRLRRVRQRHDELFDHFERHRPVEPHVRFVGRSSALGNEGADGLVDRARARALAG